MTRRNALRGLAIALAGAAFTFTATGTAAANPTVPPFDFADCPRLPADAAPAEWRCEEMVSDGHARIGRIESISLGRLKLTFAERHAKDPYAQIFGALRAQPVRVPGGLLGIPGGHEHNPLLRMDLRLEYGGYSDFQSNEQRMGELHLKARLINPLLPPTCTIGADSDPIKTEVRRVGRPEVVGQNPTVLRFTVEDRRFAAPRTHGCGPLGALLDHRLGLPAPAGANELMLPAHVALRPYDAGHM